MVAQITLPILDVSRYDANKGDGTYVPIDWVQAKTKWIGAIVKAGEANFVDPAYDEQVSAIKSAGALWGAYYLFRTYYNAIAAANLFCDQIERYGGWPTLGVWLDVEYNSQGLPGGPFLAQVASCLNEIKNRMISRGLKVPIGIYTRNSFFDPLWVQAGKPLWPKSYLYMQAQYPYITTFEQNYELIVHQNVLPTQPTPSAALGPCVLWQWTDKGKPADVPGYPPYKKAIDFNLVYKKYWNDDPITFPQPITPYQAVATTTLNIRPIPSTLSPIMGTLANGTQVTVQDDTNISFAEIKAYVSKQYLRKV